MDFLCEMLNDSKSKTLDDNLVTDKVYQLLESAYFFGKKYRLESVLYHNGILNPGCHCAHLGMESYSHLVLSNWGAEEFPFDFDFTAINMLELKLLFNEIKNRKSIAQIKVQEESTSLKSFTIFILTKDRMEDSQLPIVIKMIGVNPNAQINQLYKERFPLYTTKTCELDQLPSFLYGFCSKETILRGSQKPIHYFNYHIYALITSYSVIKIKHPYDFDSKNLGPKFDLMLPKMPIKEADTTKMYLTDAKSKSILFESDCKFGKLCSLRQPSEESYKHLGEKLEQILKHVEPKKPQFVLTAGTFATIMSKTRDMCKKNKVYQMAKDKMVLNYEAGHTEMSNVVRFSDQYILHFCMNTGQINTPKMGETADHMTYQEMGTFINLDDNPNLEDCIYTFPELSVRFTDTMVDMIKSLPKNLKLNFEFQSITGIAADENNREYIKSLDLLISFTINNIDFLYYAVL